MDVSKNSCTGCSYRDSMYAPKRNRKGREVKPSPVSFCSYMIQTGKSRFSFEGCGRKVVSVNA